MKQDKARTKATVSATCCVDADVNVEALWARACRHAEQDDDESMVLIHHLRTLLTSIYTGVRLSKLLLCDLHGAQPSTIDSCDRLHSYHLTLFVSGQSLRCGG